MVRADPPPAGKAPGDPSNATVAYWDQFFRDHPVPPMDLKLYIDRLHKVSRFKDIEAAFLAYFRHHPKSSRLQYWMYEGFAVALKFNRGDAIQPADTARIKDALGYAAILARQDGNPNFLLSTADIMLLFGYYEVTVNSGGKPVRITVGSLLDEVARKVVHRVEPLRMSLDLAVRTVDPKRMAETAEKILALGWPGSDDFIRAETRRQVDELAGDLQAANRGGEADDLQARLVTAEGRDLFVRLTWEADADLGLLVDESMGVTAGHFLPRTVFGGAIIKEGRGKAREAVYVCPRAFDGDYTVRVEVAYEDPEKPPIASAKLEIITKEGLPGEHREVRQVAFQHPKPVVVREPDGKTRTLPAAAPAKSAPVIVHVTGGRRKLVLPYSGAPQPAAIVVFPPEPTPEAKAKARAKADARARAEAQFNAHEADPSLPAPASAPGASTPRNRGAARAPAGSSRSPRTSTVP